MTGKVYPVPGVSFDPSIALIEEVDRIKIMVVGFSDVVLLHGFIEDRAPAVSKAQHVFDLWKVRKVADVADGERNIGSRVVHRVGAMIHNRLG